MRAELDASGAGCELNSGLRGRGGRKRAWHRAAAGSVESSDDGMDDGMDNGMDDGMDDATKARRELCRRPTISLLATFDIQSHHCD